MLNHLGYALRQPLSRPGLTAAKVTAVTAAGALAVAVAVPSEQAQATAAGGMLTAVDLDQRSEQQVSRSAGRTAVAPVLKAPVPAPPVSAPTFGAMSFTAVEKPPPPPKAPAQSSARSGGSSGSTGSTGSTQRSAGSGYDWAAAEACSCSRGLTQNAMRVLAAVKYSFPNMTNIGGVRPDSIADHPSGRAIDFMTSDRGYGDAIANMIISRAGELKVDYIIWRQRIWMPSRGWKSMSDRGGATANHYDHVHVSVR